MAQIEKPEAGQFCWVELQAKDPATARGFYSGLFGWSFDEMPMPGGAYAIAKAGGNQVAGLMALPEQAAKAGAPPNWGVYVAVDDVKASTDAAAKLGAKVLVGPSPMGPGTFSVLADPTGGVFMLWNTPRPMGTFLYGEPGALTWNELVSTNPDVAQGFYTRLFGWEAEAQQMPNLTYTVFKRQGVPIAGLMAQPKEMKGAPSAWASYFAVADADATFATATKLGATVLLPLTDVPDVGRFGWLADPQGAVFAILKSAMPAGG